MKTKLSHSAVSKYLQCPRMYQNHYIKRLRGKTISGALLIGGAIDKGLNILIETKSLEKAIQTFDSEWEYGFINDQKVHLPTSELVVYAKKDFDEELLPETALNEVKLNYSTQTPLELFYEILKLKEEKGFENLSIYHKQFYNFLNWSCLKVKAHLMLQAYHDKVLPKIKKVIAIQKKVIITGKSGDDIEMYIDLVVEWEDGKKYVLDNKTSSIEYDPKEGETSQQLILYYYALNKEAEPYDKLDGVGFVVLYKQIQKNRIKICEKCGNNGTGGRHKTCDNEVL